MCGQALRYASAPGHLSRADHQVANGSAKYHKLLAAGLEPDPLACEAPDEPEDEEDGVSGWAALVAALAGLAALIAWRPMR